MNMEQQNIPNCAGEQELADTTKRDSEWQQEQERKIIFDNLISYIEDEFFTNSVNRMNIDDDRAKQLNKLVGGNLENIKNCFENDLAELLGIINNMKSDVDIMPRNSFIDILLNISSAQLGSYINVLNNVQNNKNIKNVRKTLAQQFISLFEYLNYYINELIADTKKDDSENKLKAELELSEGYVSRFSDYLVEGNFEYTPSLRLVLFYFFSKLDKGHLGHAKTHSMIL